MAINATVAGKKARLHFEEVHGALAVLGFQVDDARFNARADRWEVVCRFHPLANERRPMRYKVLLEPKNGDVLEVERLNGERK